MSSSVPAEHIKPRDLADRGIDEYDLEEIRRFRRRLEDELPPNRRLDEDHTLNRDELAIRQAFKAHTSRAFYAISQQAAGIDPPGNDLSVPTCEKVPTIDPDLAENHPTEYELVEHISDAREAIQASISRSREIQRKVIALIGVGEVAHAKRLAECRRKSVQLECPTMAGGCGSTDNYVPVHCDSRLCPHCGRRRAGQAANQYAGVVASWDHPTLFRLSLPKRIEPAADEIKRAVDALRGAFGRLRGRKIPPSGEGYTWKDWKRSLRMVGRTDLARRWQKRYVDQGRWIPFEEVVPTGLYAIDVKQRPEDGTLNVHAHVLADVPWLPQAALSERWDDIIAAPVVDIRRIKGRGERDAEKAMMEVVGYAAKPPEFIDADQEAAYLKALKGSKLVQPFGDLHGNTPQVAGLLRCGDCEVAPGWWEYLGVVDGLYETTLVGGGSSDGDRPPPAV